ncbi:hypothetical protein E2562_029785 [Oryza meyeriana var. granulata]|uniref:Uncharacterized protein n=1 Tax=Oryza meyeriana var. granulata TaxID=110450 RepID=A0A6G1E459_9ORYZ|nr:hypothetical protein E2562_029785 [Oryza meyeriana var. granulata]
MLRATAAAVTATQGRFAAREPVTLVCTATGKRDALICHALLVRSSSVGCAASISASPEAHRPCRLDLRQPRSSSTRSTLICDVGGELVNSLRLEARQRRGVARGSSGDWRRERPWLRQRCVGGEDAAGGKEEYGRATLPFVSGRR